MDLVKKQRLTLSLLALMVTLPLAGIAGQTKAASTDTKAAVASATVNVNKASAQELQAIKGVGPVLADRVIAYRNEHGPFQKQEDLLNVRGIGQPTFEKMKDQITL
jgi:competence protein ComEA